MASRTFNPKLHVMTYTPVGILTGLNDGEFLNIEKNSDAMTLKVGADGESAVAVNADESGRVTVTVLATAEINRALSLACATRARGALQIKDLSGTLVASAEDAWIMKEAPISRSKEVESRAWVFESGELLIVGGGNL